MVDKQSQSNESLLAVKSNTQSVEARADFCLPSIRANKEFIGNRLSTQK